MSIISFFISFLLNISLGALANRAAGEDRVPYISGKLWNVAIYVCCLFWLGYDMYSIVEPSTIMAWLSIAAFYLIRQEGRGVAAAMSQETVVLEGGIIISHDEYLRSSKYQDIALRVDQKCIQNALYLFGLDWRKKPKTWAFWFNTMFGACRGVVLSILLLNPFMMLCSFQGVSFWLGDKIGFKKWEWGEYINGAFIFSGLYIHILLT